MPYPDLYILRHGQTVWNAEGRMQGHMDSPLTALGRDQACALTGILRGLGLPPDVAFHASPLGQARQTVALALDGLCAVPIYDARLREVSVGAFEGLTRHEIETRWPEIVGADSNVPWLFRAPGGETFEGFRDRLASWLSEQARPTVAVAHGMVSMVLRAGSRWVSTSTAPGHCQAGRGSSAVCAAVFTAGSRLDQTGACRYDAARTGD